MVAARALMGACGGVSSAGPLDEAILAQSPYGYWKLDETSGTTATDSSGNGRHGTYSGTYTLAAVAGPDGADYPTFGGGRVTIADNDVWSLGASSGLTILVMHRPTSITGASRRFLMAKGAAGNYEWELTINEDFGGQLKAWMFSSAGSNRAEGRHNSAGLTAGAWNMFIARYQNNSTSPGIELYSNSDTNGVTPIAWTGSPYANGTASLLIGHRGDNGASAYSGQLAQVAVFDESIDLTDIFLSAQAEGWF